VSVSHQTETHIIFTDAATSPKKGVSVGAFLLLNQQALVEYSEYTQEGLSTKLADITIYKEYESNKSTWSEIKTAIDALYVIQKNSDHTLKVEIYTDCQSLCDLMNHRKQKLVKSNFITSAGKVLQNADLYKELFAVAEKFQILTFKIRGHDSALHRLTLQEKIFGILDKLSRKKLRSILRTRFT
jgi:ribonuclease HI